MATKGQLTRQRIVEAAAPVFNQRGYEGSSLTDLMEATGLEKGGIYRHFSNKEELAAEAFDYAWSEAVQARRPALDPREDAVAWLKALVTNCVDRKSPVAGGCPLLNTATESDAISPLLRAHVTKALRTWVHDLQAIVASGIRRGHIRPEVDPLQVATVLVAAIEGAVMMSRLERSIAPLQRIEEHLLRYIDTEVAAQKRVTRPRTKG